MREIRDQLRILASETVLVRLEGPSGSGKGLAARFLHKASIRRKGPFVTQSMTMLAHGLELAQLSGHDAGAFTDAKRERPGAFEDAHGGTLFLDEIADAAPAVQGILLHALEDETVTRIGERRARHVDVRVVVATNRSLETEVAEGRFRLDLYHRLGPFVVRLPSLRERGDDIPELAQALLGRAAERSTRPAPKIPSAVVDCLLAYPWPGNVRELQQAMAYFFLFGRLPLPIARRSGQHRPEDRAALARQALAHNGGNKAAAARELGVSRMTIHRWLQEDRIEA